MYIFQPDREMLKMQVLKYSDYISGYVLDIGSGSYDRYSKFFKKATRYLRMDVNHGKNVDMVGSIMSIPLEDFSVDSIVCTQVLEHISDPKIAMKEMFRVLKKGGRVLITVPQTNELHEQPFDFFRYTNYGLHALASHAGFITLVEDQRGGFYAMIAQIIIRYISDIAGAEDAGMIGAIVRKAAYFFGKIMLFIDRGVPSKASLKHTIGWLFILQK